MTPSVAQVVLAVLADKSSEHYMDPRLPKGRHPLAEGGMSITCPDGLSAHWSLKTKNRYTLL